MLAFNETAEFLLTHTIVPAGPIPSICAPDGIYPYESFCETSERPEIRKYRMRHLSNLVYLKADILRFSPVKRLLADPGLPNHLCHMHPACACFNNPIICSTLKRFFIPTFLQI